MAAYAVLALAYVMSQFFRAFLAVLTPVLTSELGMTKPELGLASGMFFITFALMQFTVGLMLDRRGPRFAAGMLFPLFAGGGALLFALAQSGPMVIAAMGLIGIGCSPVLMASYYLFAKTGSPARFAMFTTGMLAFGTLGNVAGTSPLAYCAEAFGWRVSIAALGFLTLPIAAGIWLFIKPQSQSAAIKGSGYGGYVTLLRLPVLWPMFPLLAFAYLPPAGIRGLWAGPYLTETFGADSIAIGSVTFFMALSMALGSFLYGPLEKLAGTLKWVILGGNAVQVLMLLWLALAPPDSVFSTGALFSAIGMLGMTYGLQMAQGRAFLTPDLLGRGVTLMNFFNIVGIGIMQVAGGTILELVGSKGGQEAFTSLFLIYALLVTASVAVFAVSKDAPRLR